MAQHDYVIDNQTFPNTRTDINNVLQAIASVNSGGSAPSTTYAYQLWYDTGNNILKIRNADNDAFINLFTFDQSADTATPSTIDITLDTAPALGGNLQTNTKNIVFGDSASAVLGWISAYLLDKMLQKTGKVGEYDQKI